MRADPPTSAAFTLRAPRRAATPLVFDSPHSGLEMPPDFRPAASIAEIRTTCDAFVDELYGGVVEAGATLLAARFPRAYIDANRAANDIDPALLAEPWPEPVELSEHSRRGMGLIRRFALPGRPMYDRLLSLAEVRHRLDRHYRPYREALRQEVERAAGRHGDVWHFNVHSMKARGNRMNRDAGAARPDVVVSDRDGTTASPAVTRWVADFFSDRGHRVAINDPYHGADIVRSIGQPARGRHSIQIELNRACYLEEATGERGPRFAGWKRELAEFASAAAARLAGGKARGKGSRALALGDCGRSSIQRFK